jgi:hypothetical protein
MTRDKPPDPITVLVRCKTDGCGWVTPHASGYCARCRASRPEPKDLPRRCCRIGCGEPTGSEWRAICDACAKGTWAGDCGDLGPLVSW